MSIIDNLDKIENVDCPETKSYVVIISEHKAIDIIRSRKHILGEELLETIHGVDIPLPGDNGLADAMSKLPARYREVLLLRFANGYSTREIAKMMGMTEGSRAGNEFIQKLGAALSRAVRPSSDDLILYSGFALIMIVPLIMLSCWPGSPSPYIAAARGAVPMFPSARRWRRTRRSFRSMPISMVSPNTPN